MPVYSGGVAMAMSAPPNTPYDKATVIPYVVGPGTNCRGPYDSNINSYGQLRKDLAAAPAVP